MSDASSVIRGIRFAMVACLLLVHGGANAAAPAGRYTVTTDTVTDNVTGLVTWADAASLCQSLSLGGTSGWRLPTVKELQSLLDIRSYAPAIDPSAFPGAPLGYFWSSRTSAASTTSAWNVLFQDGSTGISDKGNPLRARCVR